MCIRDRNTGASKSVDTGTDILHSEATHDHPSTLMNNPYYLQTKNVNDKNYYYHTPIPN